jgi:RNA polymerase sigma-70 factor (ECF subfamily)
MPLESRDRSGQFATTHWSVVLLAGHRSSPDARAALAALLEQYWYPLYAYVRRRGYRADDAADLTQGFLARLLERDDLAAADPARGRFRSFLLSAFKHFISNERRQLATQKRGGGKATVSLDFAAGEARFALEPVDELTAEKIFERRWATTVLERVFEQLRQQYAAAGKAAIYDALREHLVGEAGAQYRTIGQGLGMSEAAVKVAAHRLRCRCRKLLREEVAHTVATEEEIDQELRDLLAAVAG